MPEELELPGDQEEEIAPVIAEEEEIVPVIAEEEDEPVAVPEREEEPEPEPIKLVDTGEDDPDRPSSLKAFGSAAAADAKKVEFRRPLNLTGTGATRCRVFSSKIQHSSLEYMENQINEWLDAEDIEVKHVGHVIGVMEGKRPEPNVVVLAWY